MAQQDSPSKYILNPFNSNIFHGTSAGSKLYLAATKEETDESKRFSLTAADHIKFRAALDQATHAFGWGAIVSANPLEYDNTNNPITFGNPLLNPDKVSFKSVQFNAA